MVVREIICIFVPEIYYFGQVAVVTMFAVANGMRY